MQRRSFLKQALLLSAAGLTINPFRVLAANPDQKPIQGRITSQGKPLAGVVVSDGYATVQSDAGGRYTLPYHADADYIFISTPAGYAFKEDRGLAGHFARKGQSAYDFTLSRLKHPDDHHRFIVWADPQIKDQPDVQQLLNESVPDLKQLLRSFPHHIPVHGMAVGDLIWDEKEMWPDYKKAVALTGIPFFQALGNHDEDYDKGGDPMSDQTFKAHFGPTYYSFNRGRAHYVILDDVRYSGSGRQYDGYIVENQLNWLRKDLQYVDPHTLLIIGLHIPVYNSVKNREALYALLTRFKQVHILSGHTHTNKNHIRDSIYEHVHGTVCGAWWTGPICKDGTPRGYGVYDVSGDKLSWYYKSIGEEPSYQFRTEVEYLNHDRVRLLANVWNVDPQWKIEWWENGDYKGLMEATKGFDPLSVRLYKGGALPHDRRKWIEPGKTDHLFMAHSIKGARIKIQVTDRFGHIYTEKIRL